MKAINRARAALWSVPVGLQLSAIYVVVIAVTLSLLGWALYSQLDRFLVENMSERLQRTTQPFLTQSYLFSRQGGFHGGEPPGPGGPGGMGANASPQTIAEERVSAALVRALSGPDVGVAVLDSSGTPISTTQTLIADNPRAVPGPPRGWESQVADGSTAQWIVTAQGGERQLLLLTPITLGMGPGVPDVQVYLEQAASLAAADAVLVELRLYILLGILVGTVLGVLAVLALTRVVLSPLERVVTTAEAIAGGDTSRRLRLPAGRNEVARLGLAFDHMVERLAATLDAQRRFVADASHELRTPLTSLEGLSEMLLIGADRGDPGVIQRTARAMHNELGRLGRLVADLLALSRLESTPAIAFVPVDVGKLLDDVATQMSPLAESREVRLFVRCEGPVSAQADADKLKQVVLNLVDNAVRYTPPGGEVIMSARTDAPSGIMLLSVQDSGPGIAPEDLPHIFDRFYRGDPSRARATGNTGLGLAIARAIVQAHGGMITAESVPGHGARFTVALAGNVSRVAPRTRREQVAVH